MKVFEETTRFKKNSKRPLVLALGNFDGIHRGHQRLLRYVVSQARRFKGQAAVFTFQQHPQRVLHPSYRPENLQSREQKIRILKDLGVEICFLQKFDRRFSSVSAEDFVEKILVKRLGIREICLGSSARFGCHRRGDFQLLKKLGAANGFRVFCAQPILWRGFPVSSTVIRSAVHRGKMKMAARCLGRPWSLEGKVLRGEGRGRWLGYPTANLDLGEFVLPARGVYAAHIRISGKARLYDGIVNAGIRPSFGKGLKFCVEAHIFDFKKNLYGKKIEIFFIQHLRGEKRFQSPELLKKQIVKDVKKARAALRQRASVL